MAFVFRLETVPKDFPRSRRIAEQIKRELAGIIHAELKDPRVGMVTITDVEVTPDCAHATAFFTLLAGEQGAGRAAAGLERAAGFLRGRLAQRLAMRAVPELRFRYDESVERGARISQLIDAALAEDSRRSRRGRR